MREEKWGERGLWRLGLCRSVMDLWRKKEEYVEEERRDGEAMRRETWRKENEIQKE